MSRIDKNHELYFNAKRLKKAKRIDKLLALLFNRKNGNVGKDTLSCSFKSILIFESHLIGDLIMGLPAYRAIRESFPDANLLFLGNSWGRDLLRDQNIFDGFYVAAVPWSVYDYSYKNMTGLLTRIWELRRKRIDLALDFRGDMRNLFLLYLTSAKSRVGYDFTGGGYWLTHTVPPPENFHIVDRNLNVARFIGAKIETDYPKLILPEGKRAWAQKYFDDRGMASIAFIHPGASQEKRQWLPERYAVVTDQLHRRGYCPVIVCGPREENICNVIIDLCEMKPHVLSVELAELPSVLSCGSLFIGLDSGIGHVAASVGLNSIILFGPQVPELTLPRGEGKIVGISRGDFECRPCSMAECNLGNACMKEIQVADVMDAVCSI